MMYLGKDAVGLATSIPIFGNLAQIEVGEYTPTSDTSISNVWFSHSLKTAPDFIFCRADNFTIEASSTQYLESSIACISSVITQAYSSSNVTGSYFIRLTKANAANTLTSAQGIVIIENYISSAGHDITNEIRLPAITQVNIHFKAGVTYHYVLGKFKTEVTSNA